MAKFSCPICYGGLPEASVSEIERKNFLGLKFLWPKGTQCCRNHLAELVQRKLAVLPFDHYRLLIFDPVPPPLTTNAKITHKPYQYFFRGIPERPHGRGKEGTAMANDIRIIRSWLEQITGSCISCFKSAEVAFFPHESLVYEEAVEDRILVHVFAIPQMKSSPIILCHFCAFERVITSIAGCDFTWPEGIFIPYQQEGMWFPTTC